MLGDEPRTSHPVRIPEGCFAIAPDKGTPTDTERRLAFRASLAFSAGRTTAPDVTRGIFGKIVTGGWQLINGVACCRCLVSLLLVGCGRKHAIDISSLFPSRRAIRDLLNEVLSLSSSSVAGGNTQSTFQSTTFTGPDDHPMVGGLCRFWTSQQSAAGHTLTTSATPRGVGITEPATSNHAIRIKP
jgi:hypothetical protein